MKQLCLFLSLAVVVCLAAISTAAPSREDEDNEPQPSCWQLSNQCDQVLGERYNFDTAEDIQDFLTSPTQMHNMATDLRQAHGCKEAVAAMTRCQSRRSSSEDMFMIFAADFIEYPGVTELAGDVATSECVSDLALGGRFMGQVEVCLQPAIPLIVQGEACQAVAAFIACFEREALEMCGAPTAEFVALYGDYVFNLSPQVANWLLEEENIDLTDCPSSQVSAAKRFVARSGILPFRR